MVGSEGTLGVITEIGLRLQPIPQAISAAVCSFGTLEGAVNSVIEIIQMGIPVARIELLDEVQMDAVNRYSKLDYPVQPTLFFEFHGSDAGVVEQAELAGEIIAEHGGEGFQWSSRPEERNRLWQARHDVFWSNKAYRPGWGAWATDVCVPISALADVLLATRADVDAAGLVAPIVGHVGDGNFHLTFLMDPDDPTALERAKAVNSAMLDRALTAGGTCTGEHGVGYGKMDYLEREHLSCLPMMRAIKRALDPQNIMNPGKVIRLDERN
jgi:D-lactate dehydrogenase (cytochrome)